MSNKITLLLISVYTIILRFWQIDRFPPLIDSSILPLRYLSAFLSVGSTMLVYLYATKIFKNVKLSLLASFVFTFLPWTIEQGRIYSQANYALFILLIFILFFNKPKRFYYKILFTVVCSLLFVIVYPDFWVFRSDSIISYQVNYLKNLFILTSPSLIFFQNITFWWGGIREFGIMHLAFLPVFLLGLYFLARTGKFEVLSLFSIIVFLSFTSPFFPESREFYLATPFFSIIASCGFYHFSKMTKEGFSYKKHLLLLLTVVLFLVYEMSQYLHFYFVHYPISVSENIDKVKEVF